MACDEPVSGTVTSTVPRYGHLRSNGFDWLKVFLQKKRKKGTMVTSWYTLCGSALTLILRGASIM